MTNRYNQHKNSEFYDDPTFYEAERHSRAQIAGRKARDNGDAFEELITASCEYYLEKGIAKIEKTPEPMRPIGKKNARGQFLACYIKQAQPDYGGTLYGGQSIYFEAKHSDDDRIEQRRLTKEQSDDLEEHWKLGAVTFVLVSFGLCDFYRIPWPVWRDMPEIYGRKYVKQSELERYKVQNKGTRIEFLDGFKPMVTIEIPPEKAEELKKTFRESLKTMTEIQKGGQNGPYNQSNKA